MPFYERGPVRIHYEEVGSGFPLLLIPGGGLNSSFQSWQTASPFNPMERYKEDFRCICADLRTANRADFVFTVSRDFVRSIKTPLLIAPDDVPAHPYKVAMEVASLAQKVEVTIYPWKDSPEHIDEVVEHARRFLKTHQPVRR